MERHALIAGVSGIIGRHLAEHLIATRLDGHRHFPPQA